MPEIESRIDYWKEFSKSYPDPNEFRSFVACDSILTKIYNFSFVPDIFENIKKYPFDEKIAELKTITKEEKKYFEHLKNEKYFKHDPEVEWLDYLNNLFGLVSATINFKKMLDEGNERQGDKISQKEIIKLLELLFHRYLSLDVTITYKEVNGIQKSVSITGRFYPFRMRRAITVRDIKKGIRKTEYQEHYPYPPTEAEVDQVFEDLDRFSVESLKKYQRKLDHISFGGPEFQKRTVRLYHKGKPYSDPFVFPIKERYRPLLLKAVKGTLKKYGRDTQNEAFGYSHNELLKIAESKLFEIALKYNKSHGTQPSGYFKKMFDFFPSELYKFHSTEEVPGDPRPMGKHPYCDPNCKKQKDYENKLPCEFETIEGYCTDPERQKHKRMVKAKIERSGGSLYDLIDKDKTTYRHELIEDPDPIIDLESKKDLLIEKLKPHERDLFHDYYEEGRTQKELSDKFSKAQSSISEELRKLEKKLIAIIEEGL